jgi:integrase
MACIRKKIVTRKLPDGARVTVGTAGKSGGRRKGSPADAGPVATWTGRDGKPKTARAFEKDGTWFIREESATWFAKYRDGHDVVVEVATGCKDEAAARAVLNDLVRQAERVRAGILSPAEDARARELQRPFLDHVRNYLDAHRGTPEWRADLERYLGRLAAVLLWRRLADVDRSGLERWLTSELRSGRSARSVNAYREAALALCNWLVRSRRLTTNPLDGLPRANQDADRRHVRRALTPEEFDRLVRATRERPVRDFELSRRGVNRGQRTKRLSPVMRTRLEYLGRERALVYLVMATTGLRRGELARLSVGNLELAGPRPCVRLQAADTKNRRADTVPLRQDVAGELRSWTAGKRPDERAFRVRKDLVHVLDLDLAAAGIDKADGRGRIVDVHSLRMTFGTWLARAGVPLTTAQKLMRHSDPKLTANLYTDAALLDLQGAVDALPLAPDNQARPKTRTRRLA